MRILHFHPSQRATPLETQIADMALYQKTAGHNVSMVTFPKSPFENFCAQKGLNTLSFNVERTVEHSKFWNAFEKAVADKKFDVVHIHASGDVPRFLQLKQLQKLCGANQPKLILQIHVILSQSRKDAWTWVSGAGLSEVWCADKQAAKTLVEYTGFDTSRVHVFHYGKNLPIDYFFDRKIARDQLGLKSESLIVGSIGSVDKTSGVEELVRGATEVMSKNPHLHLVHMGAPPEQNSEAVSFHSYLMEWVSVLKAEVRNRIHFLAPRADSPRLLRAFDLYAYTNPGESFPFGLLNAQLAGLPVMAVNTRPVLDLVSEGETGFLCDPENSTAIANMLEQALVSQDKWEKFSSSGFEKVKSEYDQKTIFDKMLAHYLA